jgi:hypothetical protein
LSPADELGQAHQIDVLDWMRATSDIYRRRKPATPPKHLVSYAALLDPHQANVFLVVVGSLPVFVTVTRTVGLESGHTDVSLWYAISGTARSPIRLDDTEFTGGRWWTAAELASGDPARLDPHFGRFFAKIRSAIS